VSRLEIVDLSRCPAAIRPLAEWHYREWYSLYPRDTIDTFAEDLGKSMGPEPVPSTWVLVEEQAVYGSVSIIQYDLDTDLTRTPWLSSLWVHPAVRGGGWGKKLLRHACLQAYRAGIPRLYLFTPEHTAFYLAQGWQTLYQTQSQGSAITVMACDLSSGKGR
jgi:GNAT superfamily N-acetyltransferase